MATYEHTWADGSVAEYRRHPYDPVVLHMEGRVLQSDGTPYDDRWYRTTDAEIMRLQRAGSNIVHLLSDVRP